MREKAIAKTTTVLNQLAKLIRTYFCFPSSSPFPANGLSPRRDPRQVKQVVQQLQNTDPDITGSLIEHLIKSREDLDSDEKSEFTSVIRQTFADWVPPAEIPPGTLFAFILFPTRANILFLL